MRIIGQDYRKTSVKYFADDINNPTSFYTGDFFNLNDDTLVARYNFHQNREDKTFHQIDFIPIFEMTFKLEEQWWNIKSGVEMFITDIDTNQVYSIVNDTVFQILNSVIKGDVIRHQADTITMNFTLNKKGKRYTIELVNMDH